MWNYWTLAVPRSNILSPAHNFGLVTNKRPAVINNKPYIFITSSPGFEYLQHMPYMRIVRTYPIKYSTNFLCQKILADGIIYAQCRTFIVNMWLHLKTTLSWQDPTSSSLISQVYKKQFFFPTPQNLSFFSNPPPRPNNCYLSTRV